MTDLKSKAAEVAKAGRFADDVLIHMSRAEVEGLASLMPNGKLPINPKTGLPEAFFFLPFLAGLGAAGAGAAGTAAATGALGAGMTAGMGAAATGLAGLGTTAALGTAGAAGTAGALGATAGGLTAASALPAATAGLGAASGAAGGLGAATGAAGAMGGAMPAITAASTPAMASLPVAGAGGLPSVLGSTPLAGTGATGGALGSSGITAAGTASGPGAAAASPIATGATPITATSTGAAGAGAVAPASASLNAGKGLGGLLGKMDMGQMLQYGALASMMMPQGGGGGGGDDEEEAELENENYDPGEAKFPKDGGNSGGTKGEWDYFPRSRYFANGGLVKGYAEGGLASLQEGGEMDDQQLVEATMLALQGQTPNADAIIQQFIATFGKDALQDLVARVQQGGGVSDGMSDSVPAVINGQNGQSQPAQLSEGEFVVPADAVSGLGNGSTEAGATQLQGMVDRTRMMRNGGMVQPPAINPRSVMPA